MFRLRLRVVGYLFWLILIASLLCKSCEVFCVTSAEVLQSHQLDLLPYLSKFETLLILRPLSNNKGNFFPKWLFKKHVHFGIGARENYYHLSRNTVSVPPVLALEGSEWISPSSSFMFAFLREKQ